VRAVDDPQRLAAALGPLGSGELLAILLRPVEERVTLIGMLHPRGGGSTELAETLIDLEIDEPRRHEVIAALRSIVQVDDLP
jgi:hypothetical protein